MSRPNRQLAPEPESEPASEPRRCGRLHPRTLDAFLTHLAAKGSVSYAANRAGLDRRVVYRLKASDEAFAARWEEALQIGVERLQDDAMKRALDGVERPVWRGGKQVGSVQQYDNRLLQFLLKAHRPETYGDKSRAGAPPLPFDLAKRLAAARPRAAAHDAEKAAREAKPEEGKSDDEKPDTDKQPG